MSLKLNTSFLCGAVSQAALDGMQQRVNNAVKTLDEEQAALAKAREAGLDLTKYPPVGWRTLPDDYNRDEFNAIVEAAEKIKKLCGRDGALVVIGIGGSYLGARAAIEFVKSENYNLAPKDTPDIYFVGNSLSSAQIMQVYDLVKDREFCINIISKSGRTTEPSLAFRMFRALAEEKYGDASKDHIFATTGLNAKTSTLYALSLEKGYATFSVPDDIGGRYSVLTAVGLLPIAVAGCDIREMMAGAKAAKEAYTDNDINLNDCYKYAAVRNVLYEQEKVTEIFAAYEPSLATTAEWWKQLYGESEGKDHRGLYPSSVVNTRDLHSLGQYIQQGRRNLFETVINIAKPKADTEIQEDPTNIDGLNFLVKDKNGNPMTFDKVNKYAFMATVLAHNDGGVPNVIINLADRSEFTFGYMVYFFELACAISGHLLGVNPFDQPGVESYKNFMYALLGKPGYEELGEKLTERIKAFDNI